MAEAWHLDPESGMDYSREHGHVTASPSANEPDSSQQQELMEGDVITPLASDQDTLSRGEANPLEEIVQHLSPTVPISEGSQSLSTTSSRSPTVTATPVTAGANKSVSHEPSMNGYFAPRTQRSRNSLRPTNASGQSSSGSLRTLAEQDDQEGQPDNTVRRSASTKVPPSPNKGRRHSKTLSMSDNVANFRRQVNTNSEPPTYPNQALSSLSPVAQYPPRPGSMLRSKSTHPTQSIQDNDMASTSRFARENMLLPQLARTADNTPMSSPGLFSPTALHSAQSPESESQRAESPQLHHLQVPKETPMVDIDHDTVTGNKIINTYEVMRELGRGEHGKVKLGRDLEHSLWVAIKIVPRYSKQRRLGRLGGPQDQTKKEVAILKKARHANVVGLIEVIDDPNKNKVYIVLEFVEHGEIQWRKTGVPIVSRINNARFEEARKGVNLTLEPSEHDQWVVNTAAMRHDGLEKARKQQPHGPTLSHYTSEHDIEEEDDNLQRTISQAQSIAHSGPYNESYASSRTHSRDDYSPVASHSLAGSMYGPYVDESSYRPERKHSIATALSHMSSELDFERDDDETSYVPALTQEEAKRAFRDTLLGLEFLHAIGIIHRDIKPSNLLVGSDGTVKISDFGVSYFGQPITEEQVESDNKILEKDAQPLDDERELARSVGTPAFWAPELCYEDSSIFTDGNTPKITGAIDLWALGITLYAMVYARLPFYASEKLGLHAAVCTAAPILPTTRLVPVDTTNTGQVTHSTVPINSNKRLDYELRYEPVPESLRDLMSKLLIKDPAYRITIAEAKQHSWVLENMPDPGQFLKTPEALEKGKQRITEPNEKEISGAVSLKRNLVQKVGRFVGNLLNIRGVSTGRKRGDSTSTNTAASTSSESITSPADSAASTLGKSERGREARRTSMPSDELLNALQRSRDTSGHPLAQSQTASPDNQELPSYFSSETPRPGLSPQASPRINPALEGRPKPPDRAISTLSTADSVRTVRASQVNPEASLDVPREHETSHGHDTVLRVKMGGLWEGTTKSFAKLTSRDRRSAHSSRSPSASRRSSENENRAAPSLAFSNMQASGTLETPGALRALDRQLGEAHASDSLTSSPTVSPEHHRQPPTSSPTAFLQAQEINQRRHIQEAQQEAEHTVVTKDIEGVTSPIECPPSPDDLTFKRQRVNLAEHEIPQQSLDLDVLPNEPSLSTAASSVDNFTNSSVTQSISNPSFIATSGASSPPEESFLSAEYKEHYQRDPYVAEIEPDFMRTADTVIEHGRQRAPTATGKPLEQQDEYYDNDRDDEEADSSDEDDIVMMGGPKKTNALKGHIH